MRLHHISIVLLILISCKSSEKKTLDFGSFKLNVPYDWYSFDLKGIDSYIGGITNGSDSLIFDYGWYSYDFKYLDPETQIFARGMINGKLALLTKPRVSSEGVIGIYIQDDVNGNHFNLIGSNIKNESVVIEIFKTLLFHDSDSLNNSEFINFSDGVRPYSGKELFKIYCAACHSKRYDLTGPALTNTSIDQMSKWLLLTNDSSDPDSIEYGVNYHKSNFNNIMSKIEVELLVNYINEDNVLPTSPSTP